MDDLIAWLRAQLDEDERVARKAAAMPYEHPSDAPWVRDRIIADRVGGNSRAVAVHRIVAMFADPARVLAEVEAKRRILDRYLDAVARQNDHDYSQFAANVQADEYRHWVIPLLAQPYAGRDGWREEWRAEQP